MGNLIVNRPFTLYFTPWLWPFFMSHPFIIIFVMAAVIGCVWRQYFIDDGLGDRHFDFTAGANFGLYRLTPPAH